MKLNQVTPELAKKIGAKKFDIAGTGSPNWVRVFVIRPDGCTIGRLSFNNRKLANIKWYKDKLQGNKIELDDSDEIACRFNWFISDIEDITHEKYLRYVEKAKLLAPMINLEKTIQRALLPKYNKTTGKKIKRKGLKYISTRQCLNKILRESYKPLFIS